MHNRNVINGSYAILGNVSTALFSFLGFLIIIRSFTKEEFGVWALFLAINSFIEMTRRGFVYHGVVKYSSENKEQQPALFSSGFLFNTCIVCVQYIAIIVISKPLSVLWHTPELVILLKTYGVFMIIYGSLKYVEYYQIINEDFKGIFIADSLYGFINLFCLILLYNGIIDSNLSSIIWIQSFSATLVLIYIFVFRKRYFKWGKVSFGLVKRLFHYGKYVFGTNLSSMLLQKTDLFMIGYFLNPAAVATYSVAVRISNYIEIPMKGLSQFIFPKIVLGFNKNGSKKAGYLFEKSVGLLLTMIIPPSLILFILAKPTLLLLGGEQYVSSVIILKILLIYSIFKPWGRIFGLSLDAMGKPHINFYMLLFSMFINVLFNYYLIQSFGVVGAATATVMSILISTVLSMMIISKMLPINLFKPFNYIWYYVDMGWTILKFKVSKS